jgi:hypothetical protein
MLLFFFAGSWGHLCPMNTIFYFFILIINHKTKVNIGLLFMGKDIQYFSSLSLGKCFISANPKAFNIFQVYQYFTIYRQYILLKFEQFS